MAITFRAVNFGTFDQVSFWVNSGAVLLGNISKNSSSFVFNTAPYTNSIDLYVVNGMFGAANGPVSVVLSPNSPALVYQETRLDQGHIKLDFTNLSQLTGEYLFDVYTTATPPEPQEYFCYYKENGVLKKVRPYVKSSSGLVEIKGVSKI